MTIIRIAPFVDCRPLGQYNAQMGNREYLQAMRGDVTRTELLKALVELGELHPEWRLGQTMANLAMSAGRTDASAVWDLEDHEALSAARHLLERRNQPVPSKI